MVNMTGKFFSLTAAGILLVGCGGGGSGNTTLHQPAGNLPSGNTNTNDPQSKKIPLLIGNAPLENVDYVNPGKSKSSQKLYRQALTPASSQRKQTDRNGIFEYSGGKVTFYIGGVKIGEIDKIPSDGKVYLQDIMQKSRDSEDDDVLKLAQFLLSISNETTYGSKKIDDQLKNEFANDTIDLKKENEKLDTLLDRVETINDTLIEIKKTIEAIEKGLSEITDSDGDGLSDAFERRVSGTAIFKKDTDGDGIDDKSEYYDFDTLNPFLSNPLIADLPKLEISIVTPPDIGFDIETSSGSSKEVSIAKGSENSDETSYSKSSEDAYSTEYAWAFSVGVDVSTGSEGVSANYSVGAEVSGAYGRSKAFGYSRDKTKARVESYEKAVTEAKENSETITGASLAVGVQIKNVGNIAYTIESTSFTSYNVDGQGVSLLGRLEQAKESGGGEAQITLAPQQSSGVIALEQALDLPTAKQLIKDPGLIKVDLSGVKLTKGSKDFTDIYTDVFRRTAKVIVDYGSGQGDKDRVELPVAVGYKIDPETKEPVRSTLADILQALHIPFNEGYEHPETRPLVNFNGIKSDDSISAQWFVTLTRNGEAYLYSQKKTYDPTKIPVIPNDKITLVYSVDRDGDKVPLRLENLYGTSDNNTDSDGDGLSDFEEINGWEQNGTIYKTDPSSADTDGDGTADKEDTIPTMQDLSHYNSLESIRYFVINDDQEYTLYESNQPKLRSQTVDVDGSQFGIEVTVSEAVKKIEVFKKNGDELELKSTLKKGESGHYSTSSDPDATGEDRMIRLFDIDSDKEYIIRVTANTGETKEYMVPIHTSQDAKRLSYEVSTTSTGIHDGKYHTRFSINGTQNSYEKRLENIWVIRSNKPYLRHLPNDLLEDGTVIKVGDVLKNDYVVVAKLTPSDDVVSFDDAIEYVNSSFVYGFYAELKGDNKSHYDYVQYKDLQTPLPAKLDLSLRANEIYVHGSKHSSYYPDWAEVDIDFLSEAFKSNGISFQTHKESFIHSNPNSINNNDRNIPIEESLFTKTLNRSTNNKSQSEFGFYKDYDSDSRSWNTFGPIGFFDLSMRGHDKVGAIYHDWDIWSKGTGNEKELIIKTPTYSGTQDYTIRLGDENNYVDVKGQITFSYHN